MKKFSKISKQKVNEEPRVKVVITEGDVFKSNVLNLMDQLLTIRTYGPVDRYLRAGSIKITGKEMFLEALLGLIDDKSLKEKAKILEGLKSKISDWETLDRGIDEVNNEINESSNKGKMISHRSKLVNVFKLYKDDKEALMGQIDEMAKRIKNGEKAFWRGLTAENMASEGQFPRSTMKQIADKFYFRAKQLGYSR